MQDTGVAGYANTDGNRGVWMLRRDVDDKTEFVMFTLWDSIGAVKAFAGEQTEVAVFYPEDEHYLIERDEFVSHFQVDTHVLPGAAVASGAGQGIPPVSHRKGAVDGARSGS
jgi:heme-degrading monooxygenase HmoA